MAGFNRKRGTYCAWCGEPMYSATEGVLVRVRQSRPGWSYMPCHRGECAATFADVMRSNGYSATYKETENA